MSSFNEESIYYFKMNNGDNIVGEIIFVDIDPLGQETLTIADPMIVELKEIEGQSAISLNRFFSFADINAIEVKSKDILCKMSVTKVFKEYYINSVKYNYLYIDKNTNQGVEDMNKVISTVVSSENQKFIHAMKQYNIDPDSFLDQLPN